MEMLNVVFACALLVFIFRTGDCYTLATNYPTKTEYLPGESISFHCSGTTTGEDENVMVQLLQLGYYMPMYRGATMSTDDGYPIVLATNDLIESNVPDRYTASGSRTGLYFDYTYTITGLALEDYGNFSCGAKVGENGEITPSSNYAQVRVLGPVLHMAIMYSQSRDGGWENNTEWDNPDNKLTWVARDRYSAYSHRDGYLAFMVQHTTSPPTEWNVTLYDPHTKTDTDITHKYWEYFASTIGTGDLPLTSHVTDQYFLTEVPTSWEDSGEIFGYEDSGNTLNFTCKVHGYDEVFEASTVLDIQFSPKETSCLPGSPQPQAPVGTKNFKLLCYTRSNPGVTVTWKANNKDLRQGITVENQNEGPYLVSVLTIDEVQESDFTSYSFEATNEHGSVTFPENAQGVPWKIKEGPAVIQASDIEAGNYPWNPNTSEASMTSTSGSLLALLVVSFLLY